MPNAKKVLFGSFLGRFLPKSALKCAKKVLFGTFLAKCANRSSARKITSSSCTVEGMRVSRQSALAPFLQRPPFFGQVPKRAFLGPFSVLFRLFLDPPFITPPITARLRRIDRGPAFYGTALLVHRRCWGLRADLLCIFCGVCLRASCIPKTMCMWLFVLLASCLVFWSIWPGSAGRGRPYSPSPPSPTKPRFSARSDRARYEFRCPALQKAPRPAPRTESCALGGGLLLMRGAGTRTQLGQSVRASPNPRRDGATSTSTAAHRPRPSFLRHGATSTSKVLGLTRGFVMHILWGLLACLLHPQDNVYVAVRSSCVLPSVLEHLAGVGGQGQALLAFPP